MCKTLHPDFWYLSGGNVANLEVSEVRRKAYILSQDVWTTLFQSGDPRSLYARSVKKTYLCSDKFWPFWAAFWAGQHLGRRRLKEAGRKLS